MVLLAIGCVGITDVCSCPPSYHGATVAGVLRDADGAPLANTHFFLFSPSDAGQDFPAPPLNAGMPRSGPDGSFRTEVMGREGLQRVAAFVYAGEGTSPVRVFIGMATFQLNGAGPDVHLDIRLPGTTFDGIITGKWVVKDVFTQSDDITILVNRKIGATAEATCVDRADVHLLPTTKIAWSDAPDVQVSSAELVPGRIVKVLPPTDPRDICPMKIEATSILISRP